MYKYLLQSVDHINAFGILALCIFFGVFCIALLKVFLGKKSTFEQQAHLPLED